MAIGVGLFGLVLILVAMVADEPGPIGAVALICLLAGALMFIRRGRQK